MAAIYLKTEHRGLAESSAQAHSASRFSSAVSRGLRESAIIALAIVALVLFMALSRRPRLTVEVKRDALRACAEVSANPRCSVLR